MEWITLVRVYVHVVDCLRELCSGAPREPSISLALPTGICWVFSTRIFRGRPRFSAGLDTDLSPLNVNRGTSELSWLLSENCWKIT